MWSQNSFFFCFLWKLKDIVFLPQKSFQVANARQLYSYRHSTVLTHWNSQQVWIYANKGYQV